MRIKTLTGLFMAALMLLTGCNATNLGKGAAIGGGGGAALGAGIGALIGKGKGAGIGAGVGAAVGTAVGAIIGKHMDNQQKEIESALAKSEELKDAEVEQTEVQGLQAIKITFPGGILFATGKSNLQPSVQVELAEFAKSLEKNPLTDIVVAGYTDNTGSMEANTRVANARANSVKSFLEESGIADSRIKAEGFPMTDYVASNDTKEGREKNRRVEIFIYPSSEMVKAAENGELN